MAWGQVYEVYSKLWFWNSPFRRYACRQQLNTREAQERAALVNQERLRGRRNLELGEQASEQKFFDQIAAERALSAIKARGGGEVRGLGMDIERDLARSTFGTAENLRREREMLGFQRSIDKQNFKYLQQQIGISRRGAKATYINRLRSFQMPGKPDPISSLFGASSGVIQGASMDASSGNSWFSKKRNKTTKQTTTNRGMSPATPQGEYL